MEKCNCATNAQKVEKGPFGDLQTLIDAHRRGHPIPRDQYDQFSHEALFAFGNWRFAHAFSAPTAVESAPGGRL